MTKDLYLPTLQYIFLQANIKYFMILPSNKIKSPVQSLEPNVATEEFPNDE